MFMVYKNKKMDYNIYICFNIRKVVFMKSFNSARSVLIILLIVLILFAYKKVKAWIIAIHNIVQLFF